jgi:hypothetical protein
MIKSPGWRILRMSWEAVAGESGKGHLQHLAVQQIADELDFQGGIGA